MTTRLLSVALLICLAGACADPAAGEWELTDVSWMQMEETEYFESCSVSSRFFATLEVEDAPGPEIEGEIDVGYEIDFSAACGESDFGESETYDFEGENEGAGDYEIEVEDFYDFDCERDGDKLECEDDDGDDWTFRR